MLVGQARAEAARHEQKRAQLAEKLATTEDAKASPTDVADAWTQLVTLTRRVRPHGGAGRRPRGQAARPRPSPRRLAAIVDAIDTLPAVTEAVAAPGRGCGPAVDVAGRDERPGGPASRHRAGDARRAGAVADEHRAPGGDRRTARRPRPGGRQGRAAPPRVDGPAHPRGDEELHLRRAARWCSTTWASCPRCGACRATAAGEAKVPVEFESLGQDRRLPMDLESTIFRILDEALGAYLSMSPERVQVHLDWTDELEARVIAERDAELTARRRAAARGARGRARRDPPDDPGPPRRPPCGGRGGEGGRDRRAPERRPGATCPIARRRSAAGPTCSPAAGSCGSSSRCRKEPTEGGGAMRPIMIDRRGARAATARPVPGSSRRRSCSGSPILIAS